MRYDVVWTKPGVERFLTMWAVEEKYLLDAIKAVLDQGGTLHNVGPHYEETGTEDD